MARTPLTLPCALCETIVTVTHWQARVDGTRLIVTLGWWDGLCAACRAAAAGTRIAAHNDPQACASVAAESGQPAGVRAGLLRQLP